MTIVSLKSALAILASSLVVVQSFSNSSPWSLHHSSRIVPALYATENSPSEKRPKQRNESSTPTCKQVFHRRDVLQSAALLATSTIFGTTTSSQPASALLTDKGSADVPNVGQSMSPPDAARRFALAVRDIDELLANYATITTAGGGDAVRLYLGTQGVKSNMYGIIKVLRILRESDLCDDIVAWTEAATEFEAYLYQAEGAAYQSLFVEYSSAKGKPEQYLATAKKDVQVMRKYMQELADLLVAPS